MGVHLRAFTTFFSYQCPKSKDECCTNVMKTSSYIPGIAQVVWGIALSGLSQDKDLSNAEKKALKARAIISVSGLGFLLIPVDLVGTIIRMFACCCRCKKSAEGQPGNVSGNGKISSAPAPQNEAGKSLEGGYSYFGVDESL